jgi:hypothetical protein
MSPRPADRRDIEGLWLLVNARSLGTAQSAVHRLHAGPASAIFGQNAREAGIEMVLYGVMFGSFASFLVWLVTSVRIFFKGSILLPVSAAVIHSLCGGAMVLVSMNAPRSSAFWAGAAGQGDGQALIGFFIAGCFLFMSGVVLMLVSCVLGVLSNHLARRRQEPALATRA